MTVFTTKIDTGSAEYLRNREDMLALVDRLRELEQRAVDRSAQRRARYEERNQLLPRERLNRLLDPGMPFLELYNMSNYLFDDDNPDTSVPGASVIAGIGFVSGVRCLVWVDDSGIKAGAITKGTLPKVRGLLAAAERFKLPVVHLVESAGANLMDYAVESWVEFGAVFYQLAQLSAGGVPCIAVLHGPSTAGGAYMPGMSDYVIGVKHNGMAALAGAALVRAATGEVADDQELGGAAMHASVTGVVEYLAEDDNHGISMARQVVADLGWNKYQLSVPQYDFAEPLYAIDELAGCVPVDYKKAYDAREIIARIVDGSDFTEFKSRYGASTVCVTAHIYGHSCALIANNGPIDPNGATKVAHFIQLCDQTNRPIIFLSNTTGYMVGTEYEQAGMIKHGAKMIQAVSNARVPRITLYVGASFGAGNYGMSGKSYEPDFLFAWPNSTTGVMGGEQAGMTMTQVMRISKERRGLPVDEDALAAQEQRLTEHFDRQSSSFYTSGRVLDQGIIDPRDTRKVLGFALETCWEARARRTQSNTFGVSRF